MICQISQFIQPFVPSIIIAIIGLVAIIGILIKQKESFNIYSKHTIIKIASCSFIAILVSLLITLPMKCGYKMICQISQFQSFIPSIIIAGIGSVVMIGIFIKQKNGFGPYTVKIVGLPFIAILASILATLPQNDINYSAAFSILGTIAGYLVGKPEEKKL